MIIRKENHKNNKRRFDLIFGVLSCFIEFLSNTFVLLYPSVFLKRGSKTTIKTLVQQIERDEPKI